MSKRDYINRLVNHDWYYHFSDDHRAWVKGKEDWEQLCQLSNEYPELKPLFKAALSWWNEKQDASYDWQTTPLKEVLEGV